MVEIGRGIVAGIKENVSLADLVRNPDKHHWQIGWEFPEDETRNRYATLNGKSYGSSKSFEEIYDSLKHDFIGIYFDNYFMDSDVAEYGEELFNELNSKLRIEVNSYANRQGEVKEFERKWEINATRATRAQERFDENWEQISDMLESINDEIDYLRSIAKTTVSGGIDRRTREARRIASLEHEKSVLWAENDRLERNMRREETRARNSRERLMEVSADLRNLQLNLDNFEGRYTDKAEEFARMIKEDIKSKGRSGMLPTQNIPLMEDTIRKRRYAGIPETPRYWATGQLISSIIITCQLI